MEKEQEQANNFIEWYKNILENHRERLFAYVAPNVFLDWYGRTCKGCKKVTQFVSGLNELKHIIENVEPRKYITHRNVSNLQPKIINKDQGDYDPTLISDKKNYTESDNIIGIDKLRESDNVTPIETVNYESFNTQTNALNNNTETQLSKEDLHTPEKSKVTVEIPLEIAMEMGGGDGPQTSIKFVVATGYLEFKTYESTSITVPQDGANRQFLKLKIAYTDDPSNNEYIIWYIIYEGKNKCRRNLLTHFENVYNEDRQEKNNALESKEKYLRV